MFDAADDRLAPDALDDDQISPGSSQRLISRVVFVGTGSGDPRYLTLGAVAALSTADLLLLPADYAAALRDIPQLPWRADAELVELPNEPSEAEVQSALDKVIACSAVGGSVCWVLPGDPLLVRSSVDLMTRCRQAGCRIEICPTVARDQVIASLAGIDISAGVSVVHYQAADAQDAPSRFITLRGADLPQLAAELAQTQSSDARVLVISAGGDVDQRTNATTVGELNQLTAQDDETLLVVTGDAAAPSELGWWERKPLLGWHVLVPHTQKSPTEIQTRLQLHGASTQNVATMGVEPPRNAQPMERAIRGLVEGEYHWIVFTDAHSVQAVLDQLASYGLDARSFSGLRVAASDDESIELLQHWGITPDLTSADQTALGLAAEFPVFDDVLDPLDGVLIPRACVATEELAAGLGELGWRVDEVQVARAVRAAPPAAEIREAIKSGGYDAVVFPSSTTVRNLVGIAGKPHASTIIAAIGPKTAETCIAQGLRVDVIAEHPGDLDLVDSLALFAEQRAAELRAAGQPVNRPSERVRRRSRQSSK